MYKKLVLIVCALVLPHYAAAQTRFLSSEQEVRKTAEGIVANLVAGNPGGAIKEIRPLSVIASTELDVFEAQFNSRQAATLGQSGPATGYEFLREDWVGTRLLRQQFIVFYEKAPQRWSFVFYRTEKGWVLSQFAFGGNAMSFFPAGG